MSEARESRLDHDSSRRSGAASERRRDRRGSILPICLLALLAANLGAMPQSLSSATPQPFTAVYEVTYRGIGAGKLTFALEAAEISGRYIYATTAAPSFLARLVVSRAALERSELEIDGDGVRPIHWRLDDGKSGDEDDGELHFDWENDTVSGTIEREAIELPTEQGLQDRLSVQIAVMTSLMRGGEPGTVPLIDDNRIKRYKYTKTGTASLNTALGPLDTVIYESTREGSSRVARFWMAPKLDYLPVRAEQERKGKVETVMTIAAFDRHPSSTE